MVRQAILVAFAAIVALTVPGAIGYSAGAPEAVCGDMTPQHGAVPQTSALPFVVKVDKNKVSAGGTVQITLSGTRGHAAFKGFLLQVRNAAGEPIGTFLINEADRYYKAINCNKNQKSYVGLGPIGDWLQKVDSLLAPLLPGRLRYEGQGESKDEPVQKHNAATHKNGEVKKNVVLNWTAPDNVKGKVNVYATVAEEAQTYWVKQKTAEIQIE